MLDKDWHSHFPPPALGLASIRILTEPCNDIEKICFVAGRYIENHGVIHNNWFNVTTQEKEQYYMTQFKNEYWDNGSLPIWITAQRQVHLKPKAKDK